MIYSYELEKLTDDELELLLFICNNWGSVIQYDPNLLKSLKKNILKQKLPFFREKIKEEFLPLFDSLVNKIV